MKPLQGWICVAALCAALSLLAGCGGGGSDPGGTGGVSSGNMNGGTGGTTGMAMTTGATTGSIATTGAATTGTSGTTGSGSGILSAEGGTLYRGTATTTISTLDSQGHSGDPRVYTKTVVIRIGDPVQAQGTVETNPFSIAVESDPPLTALEAGQLQVYSAKSIPDSIAHRNLLYQYWSIQRSGNDFSGVLTESHGSEAAASNVINVLSEVSPGTILAWPSNMNSNSTLAGTMDGGQIKIHLEGQVTSVKTFHPFTMEIAATRIS